MALVQHIGRFGGAEIENAADCFGPGIGRGVVILAIAGVSTDI
jgi:hypothetical protein